MTSWPSDLHEAFVARGFRVVRFDNRDTGLSHKFDGIIPDVREVMKAVAESRKPDVPYVLNDMADDAAAHVFGVAVGLDGEVVWAEAFGAATTDTRYAMFSCTKALIAAKG